MDPKLIALGAYVKAAFDSAASRGVLTSAGKETMMRSLISIYGSGQFAVEDQGGSSVPANARTELQKIMEENRQDVEKIVAGWGQSQPTVEK